MTAKEFAPSENWTRAAKIIAAALENGSSYGQEAAREEIHKMGEMIDQLQGQLEAIGADLDNANEHLRKLYHGTDDE